MKINQLYIFSIIIFVVQSCSFDGGLNNTSSTGVGGSLARFTIVDSFLYVIDHNALQQYDISEPTAMNFVQSIPLENGAETVFPKPPYLFIGTQTGMYIYEMTGNGGLDFISHYEHVYSCDPVVADDEYAYVTLRSGNACGNFVSANELQILSLENITQPRLINSYPMEFPKGLGIDDKTLFVCDNNTLRVFDASNPMDLTVINELNDLQPNDIIPLGDLALVISPTNLYQVDYNNLDSIHIISSLDIR